MWFTRYVCLMNTFPNYSGDLLLGWDGFYNFIEQIRLGWTDAAMIAGAREVGVSPSVVGSFPRKEAALVEVYFWSLHPVALSVLGLKLELADRNARLLFPLHYQFSKNSFLLPGVKFNGWLWTKNDMWFKDSANWIVFIFCWLSTGSFFWKAKSVSVLPLICNTWIYNWFF